jgi:hypothetical protein
MNENELEIEKLKMKIQNLENEKKVDRIIGERYQTNRAIHSDKICLGLFIGACEGVPISVVCNSFSTGPTIGTIFVILLTAFTGLIIAVIASDENPLLR